MKNFPNQASNFDRIRSTLQAIGELDASGVNTMDDGALGYGLARRNLYTFSGIDYSVATPADVEARIKVEMAKPGSNQGARTNARELRRTLQAMGWLDGSGKVTAEGAALLATAVTSADERELLADGLMQIEATTEDGTSHPVLVLLHLLSHAASNKRAGLELALVADDDSPGQTAAMLALYDRIRNLNADDRAAALGVTEAQRANSVKVFPTLAKYAGLITEDSQGVFRIAPPGVARLVAADPTVVPVEEDDAEEEQDAAPPTSPGAGRRNLTGGKRRGSTEVGRQRSRSVPAALTPEQQNEAQNRLNERTASHQELVAYFAGIIGDDAGEIWEDPTSYDLVWNVDGTCHVFEMKTIEADADSQIIRAVGQLHYYAHFNVANRFPGVPVTLSVVVDSLLPTDLCDFLQAQGIGAILAIEGLGVDGLNALGSAMVDLLPENPDGA